MMSEALAPRCTRSSDRCIISLKRWFITASRPSARNMHSPCGMLFSAVSNWPANAASRSLAINAPHEDHLQAGRDLLQGEEEQHVEKRHSEVIDAAVQHERQRQRPDASSIWTWKIHGRP